MNWAGVRVEVLVKHPDGTESSYSVTGDADIGGTDAEQKDKMAGALEMVLRTHAARRDHPEWAPFDRRIKH